MYVPAIAMTKWEWGFPATLGLLALVSIAVPLALGSISLRVRGIAFAMVTLAFAQAGNVIVQTNPGGLTGGEEGIVLNADPLPDFLVGVLNTKNLYWVALGYAAAVFLAARAAVGSSAGHVWRAIRENERRVEVLGLRPYPYKLLAFVLASFLAAWGGLVWLLLVGVTPEGRFYNLARNPRGNSEFAGACFSPDGSTLFVNIQKAGLTVAISGPWRKA